MHSVFFIVILLILCVSSRRVTAFFHNKECRVGVTNFLRPDGGPISMLCEEGKFIISGTESKLLISDVEQDMLTTMRPLKIPADIYINHSWKANGVQQWSLWNLNTFDKDDGLWYPAAFTTCGNSIDMFLGGHCKFAATETSRLYEQLPSHKAVRITARVHYIDKWTGQSVYMKKDDTIIWTGSWNWCPKSTSMPCIKYGIDVCGHSFPDKLSTFLDVQFPHTGDTLGLTFGSTIDKNTNACDISWGIDDVYIYLQK